MRVLAIATEYPTVEFPALGIFVQRQVEALRRIGLDVDVLHFLSRGRPLNHLRAWRRMRAMLAETRYDLVHAQFGHAAWIACAQCELPIVVTFRGPDLQGIVGPGERHTFKGRILVGLCRAVGSIADGVVVVSSELGRRLRHGRYQVIPSGLDLEEFRPVSRDAARRQLGWDLSTPVVLFAAQDLRMPRKRYGMAKEAFKLASNRTDCRLEVATDVHPARMPLLMNASDVLLTTSVEEGSPNVVKEALACNLPVVSVAMGDVKERLRGVAESAVCDASAESLASALVPLLERPRRSDGRRFVEHLEETAMARRVVRVYEHATAKRFGSPR